MYRARIGYGVYCVTTLKLTDTKGTSNDDLDQASQIGVREKSKSTVEKKSYQDSTLVYHLKNYCLCAPSA